VTDLPGPVRSQDADPQPLSCRSRAVDCMVWTVTKDDIRVRMSAIVMPIYDEINEIYGTDFKPGINENDGSRAGSLLPALTPFSALQISALQFPSSASRFISLRRHSAPMLCLRFSGSAGAGSGGGGGPLTMCVVTFIVPTCVQS